MSVKKWRLHTTMSVTKWRVFAYRLEGHENVRNKVAFFCFIRNKVACLYFFMSYMSSMDAKIVVTK